MKHQLSGMILIHCNRPWRLGFVFMPAHYFGLQTAAQNLVLLHVFPAVLQLYEPDERMIGSLPTQWCALRAVQHCNIASDAMGNHHDDCGCRCPFEAMHSTSSPSHDSVCFRRMHTLTAGCAILSLLCAARSAAADAIDWNAMLSPGSVKYSGDVSTLLLPVIAIDSCEPCIPPAGHR